ncbi:hypothetical protein ACSSS7_003753 [Eimeria intestinalis]
MLPHFTCWCGPRFPNEQQNKKQQQHQQQQRQQHQQEASLKATFLERSHKTRRLRPPTRGVRCLRRKTACIDFHIPNDTVMPLSTAAAPAATAANVAVSAAVKAGDSAGRI